MHSQSFNFVKTKILRYVGFCVLNTVINEIVQCYCQCGSSHNAIINMVSWKTLLTTWYVVR